MVFGAPLDPQKKRTKEKTMEAYTASADSYTARHLARVYDLFLSPTAALIAEQVVALWQQIRGAVLVPALRAAVVVCTVMSIVVLIEKVFIGLVSLYVKVFRRRPEKVYKCDAIVADAEIGSAAFPMVLVQIPMYNEKEVYQISIGAACKLAWPLDRLIVQVLDDSTDPIIKDLVKNECDKWSKKGINIKYENRKDRAGYKAGNLKEGMRQSYVESCEYVAMFDADFQPEPDFLMRTIPFLVHNPKLALVQSRWKFVNADDCLLTRMQEMSMDYHFKVEQEAGSSICAFFGYNEAGMRKPVVRDAELKQRELDISFKLARTLGTAGVWRTQAVMEAGGWEDRTTAEDMDLAVRASLLGWDFVYVGDIKVKSELPSTLKAYRSQQHRWSCGPALLFKKMLWDILEAKKVSIWKKFYMIYSFFIARRIILAFFTFFFFSVLLPVKTFFPEVIIPRWELLYVPTLITLLNSVGTRRSLHLIILWVLFENVVSLHRCKAILIGLSEAGRANEWIVTEKLGGMLKTKPAIRVTENLRIKERFHLLELGLGVFLLLCAFFDYAFRYDCFYIFIIPQSISYLIVGFGFIGVIIPN